MRPRRNFLEGEGQGNVISLLRKGRLGRCSYDQQAFAAFRAISLRFGADNFTARAFPPFTPPSFLRATAAGFSLERGLLLGGFPDRPPGDLLENGSGGQDRIGRILPAGRA
jgi:hypothetical protein